MHMSVYHRAVCNAGVSWLTPKSLAWRRVQCGCHRPLEGRVHLLWLAGMVVAHLVAEFVTW